MERQLPCCGVETGGERDNYLAAGWRQVERETYPAEGWRQVERETYPAEGWRQVEKHLPC